MGELDGRTILLTGATNGIGLEAAVELARRGATLVLVGRDPARTARATAEVRRRGGSDRVTSLLADFSSQRSVRRLAEEFRAAHDRLDVLVNNAGQVNARRTLTEDGLEATFAVNHLGYFLLTNLLLDLLEKSAPARVVVVASEAHRGATLDFADLGFERGYSVLAAYGRSKLGNVLFTRELARRLAGRGVTVNALHPGVVATGIWAGAPWFARPLLQVAARLFFVPAAEGARRIVHLAAGPAGAEATGEYFVDDRPARVGRLARDDSLAARLWDESARLVGLGAAQPGGRSR